MKKLLLALILGLVAATPASAQKTKATIQTEINTLLGDNTVGSITPAKLRTVTSDLLNSYVDWLTCAGSGGLVYWNAGTPTCLVAGTTGQVLKTNGGSLAPSWADVSSNILAGTNISVSGTSPATISVVAAPTFSGNVVAPTFNGNTLTAGTYTLTGAAAKTLTFNNSLTLAGVDSKTLTLNNSLTLAGTDATTQTFQGSGTIVARDTTDTLTNKTLDTAGTGNVLRVNGTQISALATAANYLAGTANNVPITPSVIYPAETATTFGTTTTFDFSTFINTAVTLTGNITTMTLSNVTAGKAGTIRFIQDGTGSRTAAFNTIFKFTGGVIPTLSTGINAQDFLNYNCISATICQASLNKDVRNP